MERTVVEIEIMMIMIKLMNDEGHSDNISDETDDNDNVLSVFILSLPSMMKTMILQLHMNVNGLCDNSRFDWSHLTVWPWLQFNIQRAAEEIFLSL